LSTTEDVIKKIDMILDQFAQEELGNRLSQFSLKMLKQIIAQELSVLNASKPKE